MMVSRLGIQRGNQFSLLKRPSTRDHDEDREIQAIDGLKRDKVACGKPGQDGRRE